MKLRTYMNIIIISIYLLIITISIIFASQSTNFTFLNKENSFTINYDQFDPTFSSHLTDPNSLYYSYHAYIDIEAFENIINDNSPSLVMFLYRIADNGFSVYLNDILIGSRGDLINGNSNLWNDFTDFTISTNYLQKINHLEIKTTSRYRSGLSSYPIYITNSTISSKLKSHLIFISDRIISLSLGFLVLSLFVSCFLITLNKQSSSLFIYSTLAVISIGLYCYDYLSTDYIPFDYLIYKKIVMSGLFFGITFYSFVVSHYYHYQLIKYIALITAIYYCTIAVVASNLSLFKELYTIGYFLLILNIAYWIIISILKFKYRQSVIFMTGFIFLLIYASSVILFDYFGISTTYNTPVVYISILGIIPMLLGYEVYIEKENEVHIESNKRQEAFIDSVTDSLSGSWNQRYLFSLDGTELIGSTMIIFDFDDFKKINDTYGHIVGDIVIKRISTKILEKLNATDDLIRYGGDEFIIIFYDCELKEAIERVEQIQSMINTTTIQLDNEFIEASVSIGIYNIYEALDIKEIVNRADFQLYQSKQNGKNKYSY